MFGYMREEIEVMIKHHKSEIEREKHYLRLAFIGLTKECTDDETEILDRSIKKLMNRIEKRKDRIKQLEEFLDTW